MKFTQSSTLNDIAMPPPGGQTGLHHSHQVCNRVRKFEDAMIGTRRQIELCHAQHDVAERIKL